MTMNWVRQALKRRREGAAALETLIVLGPWIVVAFMFFNLFFLLGSLMLNQSTVNRGAQQMAALGCLPDMVKKELESRSGLGMKNIRVRAIAPTLHGGGRPKTHWNRNLYLDSNNRLRGSQPNAVEIQSCVTVAGDRNPDRIIPSGNLMFMQATYDQSLILLAPVALVGGKDKLNVARSALVVSHSLEGEGI